MAVDWLADVRIYDAGADEGVVDSIVKYCGIALQSRDGQLVAMADKKECDTVRENYLKKKLGLTHSDADLDDAIQSVREIMKADRTKNRVTVYYLLARHFGVLNAFGGAAGAAAGAVGLAAAGALSGKNDDTDSGAAAPLAAAAAVAGAGAAAVTGAAAKVGDVASGAVSGAASAVSGAVDSVSDMASAPLAAVGSSFDGDDSGSGWGWLKWLLLAALAAALIFFLLRFCAPQQATAPAADADATAATAGTEAGPDAAKDADATATAAAPAPAGAGVTAGERNGKPMLTVYFDTGKSDVTNDLAAAAAKVKDYVASNAGAKLAVSGFNDPTGNAALNAELSKKRAQAVGKALEAAGIPAAAIEMVKPAESTDASGDNTAARRVEVTVQ